MIGCELGRKCAPERESYHQVMQIIFLRGRSSAAQSAGSTLRALAARSNSAQLPKPVGLLLLGKKTSTALLPIPFVPCSRVSRDRARRFTRIFARYPFADFLMRQPPFSSHEALGRSMSNGREWKPCRLESQDENPGWSPLFRSLRNPSRLPRLLSQRRQVRRPSSTTQKTPSPIAYPKNATNLTHPIYRPFLCQALRRTDAWVRKSLGGRRIGQGTHSSDSSAPSSPLKWNAEPDYITTTEGRPDPRLATRQAENLRRFAAVCTFFLQTGRVAQVHWVLRGLCCWDGSRARTEKDP